MFATKIRGKPSFRLDAYKRQRIKKVGNAALKKCELCHKKLVVLVCEEGSCGRWVVKL